MKKNKIYAMIPARIGSTRFKKKFSALKWKTYDRISLKHQKLMFLIELF